jgi:hypothetical protein
MATGKLAQRTQAAIKDIKNPKAQAAAQAAYDKATAGGSPISQKELERIQNAAAAASPTGGGPAVRALGQITRSTPPGASSAPQEQPMVQPQALPDPYAAAREADMRSAYAIVEDAFSKYGLEALIPLIRRFRIQGLSEEEAQLELEKTPEFKARFAGNEGRIARGLSAYKPGEYLQAEDTYNELLRSNNLAGLANRDTFAKLIGGAVSPAETQDRINLVFNQIDNAPDDVKNELGRYFSQFGVGDPNVQRLQIAEAILSGEDPAMKLESGIRKAQLRAGATAAGFATAEERIESLEKLITESGVSNAYVSGQQGFRTLAQIEPQTEIFAQRYGMQPVAGEELEKEAFLGLESQKRRRLKQQEQATFSGAAGTTQASLSQQVAGQL